jgi:hypothetical protein
VHVQAYVRKVLNASFATPSALQSNLTLVSLAPGVNSTAVAAAGANVSSLLLRPAANTTIGSRVYLLLTLRTSANRTVLQAAGVQVSVTGEKGQPCAAGQSVGTPAAATDFKAHHHYIQDTAAG